MIRTRLRWVWCCLFLVAGVLTGCQTPVGVARVDPEVVNEQLTRNVLSEGVPSPTTDIVLHVFDLKYAYFDDPRAALKTLHDILLTKDRSSPVAFALAELSYLYAKKTNQPSYYLAAALYAYVFLFPENPEDQPKKLDSRARIAADLYNRSLTLAFRSQDGSRVDLRSGTYTLPFGTLLVELAEEDAIDVALADLGDRAAAVGLDFTDHQYGPPDVPDRDVTAAGFVLLQHAEIHDFWFDRDDGLVHGQLSRGDSGW